MSCPPRTMCCDFEGCSPGKVPPGTGNSSEPRRQSPVTKFLRLARKPDPAIAVHPAFQTRVRCTQVNHPVRRDKRSNTVVTDDDNQETNLHRRPGEVLNGEGKLAYVVWRGWIVKRRVCMSDT